MSAHWESKALEVSSSTRPETWHDFRGFPPELYEIRYSAPGQPELAEEILKLLADAHFSHMPIALVLVTTAYGCLFTYVSRSRHSCR